ncbi:MAG: uncharacterized protein JWP87_5047 [Labilithrix sp.]|nr:uncharacterized protein [Labilithrix sp.]
MKKCVHPSHRGVRTLALTASLLLYYCAASPTAAHACGAAYPGGPVICDARQGPPGASSAPTIARIAASYAFTSTTILFGDGRRADLTRHAVFGSVQIPFTPSGSLTAQIGAGGIAGGTLVHGAARDAIGPGFAAFTGVAWRVVDARDALPFVQLTATLSATHTLTRTDDRGTRTDGTTSPGAQPETPRFTALDLRVGAIAGKTFAEVFTPYVTARAFGGPIAWRFDGAEVTGTDLYKYQLGGGLSLALFDRRLDVFAEGIALGERGIAAGLGTTFF